MEKENSSVHNELLMSGILRIPWQIGCLKSKNKRFLTRKSLIDVKVPALCEKVKQIVTTSSICEIGTYFLIFFEEIPIHIGGG